MGRSLHRLAALPFLVSGFWACELLPAPERPAADNSMAPERIRAIGDSVAMLREAPLGFILEARDAVAAELGLRLSPGDDSTRIPPGYRGRVISRDPATLEHRLDSSRVGVAEGVRVLLYERDPTGSLVLPLSEVGYLDFTDEDLAHHPPRMGIRLELDGMEMFDIIDAFFGSFGGGTGWQGTVAPGTELEFGGRTYTEGADGWGSDLYLEIRNGDRGLALVQLVRSEWPGSPAGSLDLVLTSPDMGMGWTTITSGAIEADADSEATRIQGFLFVTSRSGETQSETGVAVGGTLREPVFAHDSGPLLPPSTLAALAETWAQIFETADTLAAWQGIDLKLY